VNATVVAVLALSGWLDHRRDAAAQVEHTLNRLQEEAHVLRAAWSQFRDAPSFQRFVDGFCRQMTTSASPGHHIALFGADGRVAVRAHERADSALEAQMKASAARNLRTFTLGGERFAAYSLRLDPGADLVVAVSLQPAEEMLRTQGVRRAAATGMLVLVLFGVTSVCLLAWVRDPLRAFVSVVTAVRNRHFDQRVPPRGAAEVRYLAAGINEMVQALERTERRRASEMRRARDIQRALVGDRELSVNGCRIQALFLPTASVGGDFFDVVTLRDGTTLLAVIDVTGHGVPGALCTALLRSSLRHLAAATCDLSQIACGLNRDLCEIAAAGVFATAVLVRLGPQRGSVQYVIAGHDPPVLAAPDGGVTTLNGGGLLLGVDAATAYQTARVEVQPHSRLFVYTDGLHEAMSPDGEPFGRQRVWQLLTVTSHMPLEQQLAATLNSVRMFHGKEDLGDDVTLLGVCWGGRENEGDGPIPDPAP